MPRLPRKHSIALPLPPLPQHLNEVLAERETPVPRDQHAAQDIHDLDSEAEEAVAAFLNRQHQRLDVVLEEDAGHGALVDLAVLMRDGVLVREDGAFGGEGVGRGDGVDGGDDGHEVLGLVELVGGRGDGLIERVDQLRVESTEGEFGDDV